MENSNTYSLTPSNSKTDFSDVYSWWNYDDYDKSKKKKKKKKKAKKKAAKKRKQAKLDFQYRMLEKTADVTLHTMSDVVKMYAANKLRSSD